MSAFLKRCKTASIGCSAKSSECSKSSLPFELARMDGCSITFGDLERSVVLETHGKGRKGAVIARPVVNSALEQNSIEPFPRIEPAGSPGSLLVPIVRTTTAYEKAAQPFLPVHEKLIENIRAAFPFLSALKFNNAAIEIYSGAYRKMRYHSDSAIDLEPESHIALFSSYSAPECFGTRSLVVCRKNTLEKGKNTNANGENDSYDNSENTAEKMEEREIVLEHNSVVLFSVSTNREYRHKIVAPTRLSSPNFLWLGVTFRQSKTFACADASCATAFYFLASGGARIFLRLANDAQRKQFLMWRHQENTGNDFVWPSDVDFTLSPGDLQPITGK